MSKCKITFYIGSEEVVVEVDSTQLPQNIEELKDSLKNNKEIWKDAKSKIRYALLNRKKAPSQDLENLEKQSKAIPTTTVEVLRSKFPKADFPDGVDSIPVMYFNKYNTLRDGQKWGKFQDGDREIFIIDKYHIEHLANYLTIRSILDNDGENQNKDILSQLEECLNLVKDKFKVNDVKELILSFLHDKNKYRESKLRIGNQFVIDILEDACNNLINTMGFFRKNHPDPIINSIAHKVDIKGNNVFLNKGALHSILQANQLINFSSDKKFKEFFDQPVKDIQIKLASGEIDATGYTLDYLKSLFEDVSEDKNAWEILANDLLARDRTFVKSFSKSSGDNLIFSNNVTFRTYGIEMPILKNITEPQYYKGQYITAVYDRTESVKYYVTKSYPLEDVETKEFNTEQGAKQYISNIKRVVSKHSFLPLHYSDRAIKDDPYRKIVKNIGYVNEGQIITVLDYNIIPPNGSSELEDGFLYGQATVQEFQDYIFNLRDEDGRMFFLSDERNTIEKNIDSPEKMALFVTEIKNRRNSTTNRQLTEVHKKQLLEEVIPNIANATNKYYFVDSVKGSQVILIPFNNVTEVEQYQKEDRSIPTTKLWKAISNSFSTVIPVPINILTAEQMNTQFQQYSDAKAFIKGGNIYINLANASPEDLMHEYAHILLAYLKNNDQYRETYKKLIEAVWNYGNTNRRNNIVTNYSDSSMEDKMEEFFVSEFGRWVENDSNLNLDQIFRGNPVLEDSKKLFDSRNQTKSIKELFSKSVKDIMNNFNDNVSILLRENPSLMDEQFQKSFTLSRRQSDWIRRRINNEELIEDCGE